VLLDPFHIVPEIVEMSQNLKQQMAEFEKQKNGQVISLNRRVND
jgi:hypothetical protein